MKTKKECLLCLANQASYVMKLTSQPDKIIQKTLSATDLALQSSQNVQAPPPQLATKVYGTIASITGNPDIYQNIKADCIQKAKHITDRLLCDKPFFPDVFSELEWAIHIAALGNVIDYGSATSFDINKQIFNLDHLDFAIFDLKPFMDKLEHSRTLVYIGDNAGENLFDEILIKTLKTHYPDLRIIYFVRGIPIINDITLNDLIFHSECKNIFDLCEVVDSGVKSPGFIYEFASPIAQKLFDEADIILAKGMGNFECLESKEDSRIFFAF